MPDGYVGAVNGAGNDACRGVRVAAGGGRGGPHAPAVACVRVDRLRSGAGDRLTEAELAAGLRHHSGKKAVQALSVTAASAVVDEVKAARWVTGQRRAGERGRHRYIAHDVAPEARPDPSRMRNPAPSPATATLPVLTPRS